MAELQKKMLKRFITMIFLVSFVVSMIMLGVSNYVFFDILILFFATLGTYEIYHSFKVSGYKNIIAPPLVLAVGIYPAWHFLGMEGLILIAACCVAIALTVFTFKGDMEMKDLMATIFTLVYPYSLICIAFLLTKEHCATFCISYAVFIPVFADTFAYLVGSTLKGPKLCPAISPKKTISGAIGGLFGAILGSILFFLLFDYSNWLSVGYITFSENIGASVAIYLVLGLLGGLVSELGDLAASRVKRAIGIKDFGNIFPGHGGSLDRVDSIMFMLVLLLITFQFVN